MEELIRDRIHEALEAESTPPSLRARVMDSLPVTDRQAARRPLRLTGQWSASAVAVLLAFAIIVGLLYSRGLLPFVPVRPPVVPPVRLISPEGVAVAPDGSVYLSDFLGDRVFRIWPDGKVVVVAGGGSGGDGPATKAFLNHPANLALDRSGNLYIADTPAGSIRILDTHGNISSLVITPALTTPSGIAIDASGVLWVSELVGPLRQVFVNEGGRNNQLDFSSIPPPSVIPGYMAFDAAGNLYVADRKGGPSDNPLYQNPPGGGCRIIRVDPAKRMSVVAGTGVCGYSGDGGLATAAEMDDPNGIAFDSVGNLYFADANNHRIRRIDKNGIITTVAGIGAEGDLDGSVDARSAELRFPFGMAMSPAGLLYFADMTCECWNAPAPGRLRALNIRTGVITTVMTGQTLISG